MRDNKDIIESMEKLYQEYEKEVENAKKKGLLSNKTAHTYLLHPWNFIRWCKGEFEPGRKNVKNN